MGKDYIAKSRDTKGLDFYSTSRYLIKPTPSSVIIYKLVNLSSGIKVVGSRGISKNIAIEIRSVKVDPLRSGPTSSEFLNYPTIFRKPHQRSGSIIRIEIF